ncbi:hypothetical protein Taro_027488, partial [Colocasia esculenta]|nr:hypothetical protein [Colocasia esculenta]
MAASSISLPAADAVQVLVSALADESPAVRDAAAAALKEIAPMKPLLVLNCCSAVSRGGRRRFGNMAGAFSVMASAVRAMEKKDVDETFIMSLAKIATSEMITSKELNTDWQRSASGLLVSIGSHDPDLMMEEVFRHFSGPNSALPAMVQILADFASSEALLFTPRLKDVLSRVLPILGNVRDSQRPIFANAFKCWCQAASRCRGDCPSDWLLDGDVMSFLNSVFELLLRVWASSRDLKTYNEVQHCFLIIGSVYPQDLFLFLLDKSQHKDEASTIGALCVLKHLLPRLCEAWHSKRTLLVDSARLLLDEHSLGVQKALAEELGIVYPF